MNKELEQLDLEMFFDDDLPDLQTIDGWILVDGGQTCCIITKDSKRFYELEREHEYLGYGDWCYRPARVVGEVKAKRTVTVTLTWELINDKDSYVSVHEE